MCTEVIWNVTPRKQSEGVGKEKWERRGEKAKKVRINLKVTAVDS